MAVTGYIDQHEKDYADLTHGEITSFPFGNGVPFSIMIINKISPSLMTEKFLIDCKLLADTTASPFPIDDLYGGGAYGEAWSDRNIINMPNTTRNQTMLTYFRIFWAAGENSPTTIFN